MTDVAVRLVHCELAGPHCVEGGRVTVVLEVRAVVRRALAAGLGDCKGKINFDGTVDFSVGSSFPVTKTLDIELALKCRTAYFSRLNVQKLFLKLTQTADSES